MLQNVSDTSIASCRTLVMDVRNLTRGVIPLSPLPFLMNELKQGLGNRPIYRSLQMNDTVKPCCQDTK